MVVNKWIFRESDPPFHPAVFIIFPRTTAAIGRNSEAIIHIGDRFVGSSNFIPRESHQITMDFQFFLVKSPYVPMVSQSKPILQVHPRYLDRG